MFSEMMASALRASLWLVVLVGLGCGNSGESGSTGDRRDAGSSPDDGSGADANGRFGATADAQPPDADDPPESTIIRSVTVSRGFACVVFDDGRFDCWWDGVGNDPLVDLGVDYSRRFQTLVANGGLCGIEVDRALTCFGYDDPRLNGNFTDVSIGTDGEICALRTDGDPICVEGYEFGEVEWLKDADFGSGYVDFEVGRGWACGLTPDGQAECTPNPIQDPGTTGPAGRYSEIKTAHIEACGILVEGGVDCWGNLSFPSQREYPREGRFRDISYKGFSGCVLDDQQLPTCWQVDESPPDGLLMKAVGAADALNFACGVTLEDKVVCWGSASEQLAARIPEYLRHTPDL